MNNKGNGNIKKLLSPGGVKTEYCVILSEVSEDALGATTSKSELIPKSFFHYLWFGILKRKNDCEQKAKGIITVVRNPAGRIWRVRNIICEPNLATHCKPFNSRACFNFGRVPLVSQHHAWLAYS